MLEPMTVRVEVWPVAADEISLWLLSGADAWRSDAVPADSEPHAEVEWVLTRESQAVEDVALLHSTSWRVEGPAVLLTYIAVLRTDGLVHDKWPAAKPISLELSEHVGKPFRHGPAEPPTPRYIDVLLHGIRHLRFLLDTDSESGAALDQHWHRYLRALEPALATMYSDQQPATGEQRP